MTKLPIFPIPKVVFPNQLFGIHLYQERYKELLNECLQDGISFAVTAIIDNEIMKYGVSVSLDEVKKEHIDGSIDATFVGSDVLKIVSFEKALPPQLYEIVQVEQTDEALGTEPLILKTFLDKLAPLEQYLKASAGYVPWDLTTVTEGWSYYVAPYLGLPLDKEYEILKIRNESGRLMLLNRYLDSIMNSSDYFVLSGILDKTRWNGHPHLFDIQDVDWENFD